LFEPCTWKQDCFEQVSFGSRLSDLAQDWTDVSSNVADLMASAASCLRGAKNVVAFFRISVFEFSEPLLNFVLNILIGLRPTFERLPPSLLNLGWPILEFPEYPIDAKCFGPW